MPLDDEIIEENPLEGEEDTPDNPTDNPINSDDPEVEGDESLVQDEIDSGSSVPEEEQSEPDEVPDEVLDDNSDINFDETEFPEADPELDFDEFDYPEEYITYVYNSVSDNELDYSEEEIETYNYSEAVEVYTDLEAFEASTIQVDLYQYTILNRLEFIQYALCIVIALLFLQIFVRYKK